MNRTQAMALLTLVADLYVIVQAPDPELAAARASSNGRTHSETTPAAATAPTTD